MRIVEGIQFNPKTTLSTLQFKNEHVNNIIISLLITILIACLRSIVRRLVVVNNKDVFRFGPYLRAFVFDSLADPALIWSWFRGRYTFRDKGGSHSKLRVCNKLLVIPLLARCAILATSIVTIFLAIPYEKKIDGCSGGDFALIQQRWRPILPENFPTENQFCLPLDMNTSVGEMRSSLSVCSTLVPIPQPDTLVSILDNMETQSIPAVIMASYDPFTGFLLSRLVSGNKSVLVATSVEWRLSNGDLLRSTVSDYNAGVHLKVVGDVVRNFTSWGCELTRVRQYPEDEPSFIGTLDCSFDPSEFPGRVSTAMVGSLHFLEQDYVAARFRLRRDYEMMLEQACGAEVTIVRPLLNLVPLTVVAVVAFALSTIVTGFLTCRSDVTYNGFHMVRELLGHDTGANPLQATKQERDEAVPVRRYACADGESAHVGFLEGEGDDEVQQFEERRRVSRCSQVAGCGRRFVRTTQRGEV